jgi:hypothetical protein
MFTDQGGFPMGETTHSPARTAIPATASLRVDPERLEQMWAMRPAERIQAALEGKFTLGEMLRWASRRPAEPPLVDGEWFFISAYLADSSEGVE